MATLEITNKTLKVVGAPESEGEWWWRWIKSLFAKPPDGPGEQLVDSHSLNGLQRASLDPHLAPWSLEWLVTKQFKSRKFWTLSLVLANDRTKVISSLDYATMRLAHDQVHAAMNAKDGFLANLTIANSSIVIDSVVGRDVGNNVGGDGNAKKT